MAVAMRIRNFLFGAFACLIAASSLAPAQADDEWPVRHRLLGKHGEKSEDVSGIACTQGEGFPRACLVIDDNIQAAQLITLNDGELTAGGPAPLIENSFEGKPLELDGEGVAYADGFYFVIGSHGHPRDRKHKLKPDKDAEQIKARIAAASQIVRLRVNADGTVGQPERTGKLREIIASIPALRPFLDRRLDENGLTIEGIAVKDGRLFAGFRGPALPQGTAAILSVALASLFDSEPPAPVLYRLPLGDGRGVRDLTVYADGLLVLAGPSADSDGAYSIHGWDGRSETVRLLGLIPGTPGKEDGGKAEAILPLDERGGKLRVLILFDGKKEGGPAVYEVAAP